MSAPLATGLGCDLWRQFSQVIVLDLNMRSTGPLCRLLHQMRNGKITPEVWQSLEARVLRPTSTGQPDPRLHQFPFSTHTVHCIVHRHALRVPLSYSMALRDSIQRSEIFYVLHACDEVQPEDQQLFDASARREALRIPNPRNSGQLPGVLPLYVGMRLRLHNCKDCVRLGLMNGAEVELLQIIFAPPEWTDRPINARAGDLNVLQYMPQALVVRAIGATWTLPQHCHIPGVTACNHVGVFALKPTCETFVFKTKGPRDRPLRIMRTMYPLLPSSTCIVYGAQGESWPAVLADLACPPRMSPEVHWLANYVILSRATTLEGILLLRNAEKHELERGPPAYLVAEIDRLLDLEKRCTKQLQLQLKQLRHIPAEILNLFQPSTAKTQSQRHQERMTAVTPLSPNAAAPRWRMHGKQSPNLPPPTPQPSQQPANMPSDTSPRPAASQRPADAPLQTHFAGFVERQTPGPQRCGLHALNNAIGFHCFDPCDMSFAADTFMAEDGFDLGDVIEDHVRDGGWYSSEVLATALRTTAMQKYDRIRWQMSLAPARHLADLAAALGAIQNRSNTHWIALRCYSGHLYELDSLQLTPRHVPHQSVPQLLAEHPTYCIHAV